ncbi:MAG: NADPH-dependent F420 reductase [Candidatus Methanofastidiosa archaeon]|nr:NADPH-dependent F420 reductase [Candidatus Methanofastidiosa archaeon]
MKSISIIGGTGNQGLGLAMRFVKAGLPIVIGSRDDTKARIAVDEIKEKFPNAQVEGVDNTTAVEMGDIIILSVPYKFMVDTIKSIKGALTEDKILVSLCVPLAIAVGGKATEMVRPWEGSAAEQAQSIVPNVKVVGAFQNICAARLMDLENTVEDDVLVCSNDKDARQEIMDLVKMIDGLRGINGGTLCNCRITESLTPLIIGLNIRYKVTKGLGIRFTYLYDI